MGPRITPGKSYGCSELQTDVSKHFRFLWNFKKAGKKFENTRTFLFVIVLFCSKRRWMAVQPPSLELSKICLCKQSVQCKYLLYICCILCWFDSSLSQQSSSHLSVVGVSVYYLLSSTLLGEDNWRIFSEFWTKIGTYSLISPKNQAQSSWKYNNINFEKYSDLLQEMWTEIKTYGYC